MVVEALRIDGVVLCPRCKIPMEYVSVTEKSSSGTRILRYYRCPACHTRIVDERIDIIKTASGYKMRAVVDGKTVISVARPTKKKKFRG